MISILIWLINVHPAIRTTGQLVVKMGAAATTFQLVVPGRRVNTGWHGSSWFWFIFFLGILTGCAGDIGEADATKRDPLLGMKTRFGGSV